MTDGTLTSILTQFAMLFSAGIKNLTPFAEALWFTFAAIDLAATFALGLGEIDPFKTLIRKSLRYGIILWFVDDYKFLLDHWIDGAVFLGLTAGGNVITANQITDPSHIISKGLDTAWPIMESAKNQVGLSIANIPQALTMVLCYILIVFSYLVMAFQIFLTYLEVYILGTLALMFMPWGASDQAKFQFEKAIGGIIAVGIKLMTLAFVLAAALPLLSKMSLPANVDQSGAFTLLGTAGAVALLCWLAPGLASGLMSGHPSLSAGAALGAVGAGASMAYAAKTMVTGAAGMAMKVPGVQQGVGAIQAAVGGAIGGMYEATKGAIFGNGSSGNNSNSFSGASTSAAASTSTSVQKMLSEAQKNQGGDGI